MNSSDVARDAAEEALLNEYQDKLEELRVMEEQVKFLRAQLQGARAWASKGDLWNAARVLCVPHEHRLVLAEYDVDPADGLSYLGIDTAY